MGTNFDFSLHCRRSISSGALGAGATFKWLADAAVTAVHISYHNMGGTALTTAASVDNAGSVIGDSSADLAADTVEEKTTLANTTIADGATVLFTSGDQPCEIVLTVHSTYTA